MSEQITFHVLGLGHQAVNEKVTSCAFIMKVVNMCKMAKLAGHRVILYHAGAARDLWYVDNYVQVVPEYVMQSTYGDNYASTYNQGFLVGDRAWKTFIREAAQKVGNNISGRNHIVLASFGNFHRDCMPSEAAALSVEMGVGYAGIFAKHKVFESYAWQAHLYSQFNLQPALLENDTVIPNYIDPDMFEYGAKESKKDYALYMGRVIASKGVAKAWAACKAAGIPLRIVGAPPPGLEDFSWIGEGVTANDIEPAVGPKERATLLKEAKVLLCPTEYVEPFGGVAVEAAYSGTPVISTDWGGFTDHVINGKTGFRVRDVHQIVGALQSLDSISNATCHEWGKRFTLPQVWPKYEAYFRHLLWLREDS